MDNQIKSVQRLAKRIVAGTIFVTLLLGASAAVFSALAAGITALSNANSYNSTTQATLSGSASKNETGVTGSTEANAGVTTTTTSPMISSGGSSPVGLTGSLPSGPGQPMQNPAATGYNGQVAGNLNWGDRVSNSLDHMHSPVTEALDSGGVTLGNQVSHSFGHVLSNLIQFLFVEQADSSNSANSTPPSITFGSTPPSQSGNGSSGY